MLIQETEERLVTGYKVHKGNPVDHSLLPSAIKEHRKVFRRVPKKDAADRGFGTAKNDQFLAEQGVKQRFDGARCSVAGAVWAHNLTRLATMG